MTRADPRQFSRRGHGRHDARRAAGVPNVAPLLVAAVSGCFGAAAGCAPVGGSVPDHLLTGALAVALALAATTASGLSLMVGSVVVIAAGDSLTLHVIGIAALLATVVLERDDRRLPVVRALIGTVIVQALLRLPWTSPTRGSAVVALVGLAPILVSGVFGAPAWVRRTVVRSGWVLGALAVTVSLVAVLTSMGSGRARAASHATSASAASSRPSPASPPSSRPISA